MGRAPKELNLQGGLVVSAVCQSPMLQLMVPVLTEPFFPQFPHYNSLYRSLAISLCKCLYFNFFFPGKQQSDMEGRRIPRFW